MDLLDNLNPQQREAVCAGDESTLILAGAGSGKTRVLTTRIAWLLSTRRAAPWEILAVTFTNKAAKEMLTRLEAMLPAMTRGMWVGTFHGICNRILRTHWQDCGLPQSFQIMDSSDQLAAVRRVLKTAGVDENAYPPKDIQNFINHAKEAGLRATTLSSGPDRETGRRIELYSLYDAQCNREGVVDFGELMLRCYELLSRNEILLTHYRERFRYILVDEFQDTSRLQYSWLKLLAGGGSGKSAVPLFAVGDDDQSIYGFRGAEVENMRRFTSECGVHNVIRLEQNYRSFGTILDAANALIANNSDRLGKNLWTDGSRGDAITVHPDESERDEADYIALMIDGRRRQMKGRWSDFAVLYRANAQSRAVEHALMTRSIPYRVYGGLRYFDRQEVKHALAYLRLVANPDDDTSFLRVVNMPPRGIGARTVELLGEKARTAGVSLMQACSLMEGAARTKLAAFTSLIGRMRGAMQELRLAEKAQVAIKDSGLLDFYASKTDEGTGSRNEREERIANLNELVAAAAGFRIEDNPLLAQVGDEDPVVMDELSAFLAYASLEAGERQAGEGDDAVQLMTVHASKGLEFNTVFITGLEEGLFPHDNSGDEAGLQEERRLMYVAITRAREKLYLTMAGQRFLNGYTRYSLPSRFIREIPDKLLRWDGAASPARPANPWAGRSPLGRLRGENDWSEPRPAQTGWRPRPGAAPARIAGVYRASDLVLPADAKPHPMQLKVTAGGFHAGMDVRHPKFGAGTIEMVIGSGEAARVRVRFKTCGTKELLLRLAKLEAV